MSEKSCSQTTSDILGFISGVRAFVQAQAPDLVKTFDIYAQEAVVGRALFAPQLHSLKRAAPIVEIGAGMMLLSCQLQREGFEVTAVEPVGPGFSHFHRLQALVLQYAEGQGCAPRVVPMAAEDMSFDGAFDFAYSMNVMEHVRDVQAVITRSIAALRIGGQYRFTCPNYLFPYEPHFNIPTLISKRATEKYLGSRIFRNPNIDDPHGTWRSLNWITVPQIASVAHRLPNADVSFSRQLLSDTLERILHDPVFAARRSAWANGIIKALVNSRLHKIAKWVPASAHPIIDCTLTRTH